MQATGVLTNVPGPVHARTLHGKTIEEVRTSYIFCL
jgi:hypothetical protein